LTILVAAGKQGFGFGLFGFAHKSALQAACKAR